MLRARSASGVHRLESAFDALRGYACAPELVADSSVARSPFSQGPSSQLGEASIVEKPRSDERLDRTRALHVREAGCVEANTHLGRAPFAVTKNAVRDI